MNDRFEPADALLYTASGTLAFFDPAARRVRHAPQAEAPRNLVLRVEGAFGRLLTPSPDGTTLLSCVLPLWDSGPCVLEPMDHPYRLVCIHPRPGVLTLLHTGASLQAEPNGRLSMLPEGEQPEAEFPAVLIRTLAIARTLATGRWLDADTALPVAIAPADNAGVPMLSVGGLPLGLAGVPGPFVTEQDGAAAPVTRVHVALEGGRLLGLVRYRPLVCFALFGENPYYECLTLALDALAAHGQFDGDICVAANRPRTKVARYIPDAFRHRWIHAHADIHTRLFTRFDMPYWGLEAFQPVLYMDVDVVANAPIEPLLRDLAVSRLLHVATESHLLPRLEGQPASAYHTNPLGNWFGTWLCEGDFRFAAKSFRLGSSGILGFPNMATVRTAFAVVRMLRRTADPALIEAFTDQALVNYALHLLGGADFTLLDQWTDFVRASDPFPGTPRGLVHFHTGVGDGEGKRNAMAVYLAMLSQKAPAPERKRVSRQQRRARVPHDG